MNEQVFKIFADKVKFRGIACKDYHQGEFCMLFQVKGVEYLIDGITAEMRRSPTWNIKNASIYHYDCEDTKNKNDECAFCSYEYTKNKVMTEDMKCIQLK